MVFQTPDDGGAGGAEPAPAPEAIDAPPVAQEPEYSKPKYYSQIESNMTQSREAQCGIAEDGYEDFKEKFDEYKMIEISKSNLSMYLQQQKCALVDMINEKNHISEYFIKTINGVSSQRLVLFRTINTNFIFNLDSRKFTTFFGDDDFTVTA